MDKKSKIFFLVFFLLIVGSVAVTYWKIMIKRDYVVEAQTDCDPYTEKCFIWECDPQSTVEGEACTGDPESDTWYFQVARRNASKIPLCDPDKDENCDPWTCEEGEKDCSVEFCTEDQLEAQYAAGCNDPVKYAEENPIEEEVVEEETVCEEGDTECATTGEEESAGGSDEDASVEVDTENVPENDKATTDTSVEPSI